MAALLEARSEATGSVAVLGPRMLAAAAVARGRSRAAFFAHFGLEPALLDDVTARVPVQQAVAMWEQRPALIGDDELGLHTAELEAAAPQGLGGQLLASGATPGGPGARRRAPAPLRRAFAFGREVARVTLARADLELASRGRARRALRR